MRVFEPAAGTTKVSRFAPARPPTVQQGQSSSGEPAPARRDEDRFDVPPSWRRTIIARRGGAAGPPVTTGPAARTAAAEFLRPLSTGIRAVLTDPSGDPRVARAAETYLEGAGTPLGAAAMAAAAAHAYGWGNIDRIRALADGWVAERGVVFAARAVVEFSGLPVDQGPYPPRTGQVRIGRHPGQSPAGWGHHAHWLAIATRVRAHLAVATDAEYAAAAEALAAHRTGSARQRVAICFLLPTQTEWVDQECRALPATGDYAMAGLLWCAVGSLRQLDLLTEQVRIWWVIQHLSLVTTVVDGVGPAIAPKLAQWCDRADADADARQRLLSALAVLPTDEALRLLLDRLDQRHVAAAVRDTANRFPVRAVRLLAEAAAGPQPRAGIAAELLRAHVLAHPDAVDAVRPVAGPRRPDGPGLTADQLADRLVPDLGLDPDGGLVLDYGPRRFAVVFDERLRPYVVADDGTPGRVPPRPGAGDDPALAVAARDRFDALRAAVAPVAAEQIHRLEQAMAGQRRWTATEFGALLAGHPLLGHLVRRLVWAAYDGTTVTAFRVAGDRGYVDVDDDRYVPAGDALVGVAHPVQLGAATAHWSTRFADRRIRQPFPQLTRGVHTLTDVERAATTLARFTDAKIAADRLVDLERRGWRRGWPDAGQGWLEWPTVAGPAVIVDLDPGLDRGPGHDGAALDILPTHRLARVWLADRPTVLPGPIPPAGTDPAGGAAPDTGSHLDRGTGFAARPRFAAGLRFGALDPVTASEMLRDLDEVTG